MIAHFVLAGQSNIDQWFHAGDGAALLAFKETFLLLNPEYTDVQFFDAARGGSAMLSASASDYADSRAADDPDLHGRISENYWYDETTGTGGPNLDLFVGRLEDAVASGTEFLGVIWAQGEADTTYVAAHGAEEYTAGLTYVLDQLMEASGADRTYIQALGDRAFYSDELHGGTEDIRAAQQSVADADDAIVVATTIFDLELRDSTHPTTEAYEIAARRMATAISTGETSPSVEQALLLDARTLLVQFDLTPGQSFESLSLPDSFTLIDGSSEVVIVSAEITSGGLLRIEAASDLIAPTLSYGTADVSHAMDAEDFIYVSGTGGLVPVLPFEIPVASPRLETVETETGLRIESGALSEVVTGLSGDDHLIGNGGHDTLIGGWGADRLEGGSGSDVFVLGEDGAMDIIYDFEVTRDAIGLVGASADGVTFEIHDGLGLEVRTQDGQRALLLGLDLESAQDIRFHTLGSEADNLLLGHDGADRLFGHSGDDTLDGGAGTDRIFTGDGADVVVFGNGYGLDVVYDFDVSSDAIRLTNTSADALSVHVYKSTDLELRTDAGDRLVLRNISLDAFDEITFYDAPPIVGEISGTNANDILHGTSLPDLIDGLGGTDRIYTGAGADVIVFREGSGLDVVYDFTLGEDRILLSPADYDAMRLLTYGQDDAEIRLQSGDRLVLRDVDVTALDADHFIFDVPEVFG